MLDFPNNPNEGDTHIQKGQSWTFNNGAWVVGLGRGTAQEIVGSGLPSAGWQVWGDTLIQWGEVVCTAQSLNRVTFTQPFKTPPKVSGVSISNGNQYMGIDAAAGAELTATHMDVRMSSSEGAGAVSGTAAWLAIGEAPDNLKKPKTIATGAAGGSIPLVTEFHDPNGLASWRIINNTLECWGEETISQVGDGAITTFPKTFARPPTVVATPKAKPGGQAVRTLTIQETSTTQFEHWTTDSNGNTGDPLDRITWHAIGEWDGVS